MSLRKWRKYTAMLLVACILASLLPALAGASTPLQAQTPDLSALSLPSSASDELEPQTVTEYLGELEEGLPTPEPDAAPEANPFAVGADAAPAAPVLEPLAKSVVNDPVLAIRGTAAPGSSVEVTAKAAEGEPIPAGSAVADPESGAFEVTYEMPEDGSYTFTATAVDESGTSAASDPIAVTLDRAPPPDPVGLSWEPLGSDRIMLDWSYSLEEGAVTFQLERDGLLLADGLDDLFYVDSGLAESSLYEYELWVYDEAGNRSENSAKILAGTDSQNDIPVSVNSDGNTMGGEYPSISDDGSYVSFASIYNLMGGIEDWKRKMYIRNILAGPGLYELAGPFQELGGSASLPLIPASIGEDGYGIAYSQASSGRMTVTQFLPYIGSYVFPREGVVHQVEPSTSDDYNVLAYTGLSGDPVPLSHIYAYNGILREYTRLDVPGRPSSEFISNWNPVVSGDGTSIAFLNGDKDPYRSTPASALFLFDLEAKNFEQVEIAEWPSGERLTSFKMNDDASMFVLQSLIVAGEQEGKGRSYIYDRSKNKLQPVVVPADVQLSEAAISANGRFAAFAYSRSAPGKEAPFLGEQGVVRYDIAEESFRPIGNPGFANKQPDISGDGSRIVYQSEFGIRVVCLGGPCDGSTEPPEGEVQSARWIVDQSIHGQAKMGSTIRLLAIADPEQTLEGKLSYRAWDGEELRDATAIATLEDAAGNGVYLGSFELPEGAAQIVSFEAYPSGQPERKVVSTQYATDVAGALHLNLTSLEPGFWAGYRLILSSGGQSQGSQVVLSNAAEYSLSLGDSDDYRLRIADAQGNLAYDGSGIEIRNGRITEHKIELKAPAIVRIKLEDENGDALAGTKISAERKDAFARYSLLTNGAGEAELPSSHFKGERWAIQPLVSKPLIQPEPREVVLNAGENRVVISVASYAKGKLVGTVKSADGRPIAGAVLKLANPDYPSLQSVSDAQGRYSFESYSGTYQLTVQSGRSEYPYVKSEEIVLPGNDTLTRNIVISSTAGPGGIKVQLLTKRLDGIWTRASLNDSVDAIHYRLSVKPIKAELQKGFQTSGMHNSVVRLLGVPGEQYNVCVDGYEFNMGKACSVATLDDLRYGEVTIQLKEAARIVGRIDRSSLPFNVETISYWLYEEDPQTGKLSRLRSFRVDAQGRFSISVGEPGRYWVHSYASTYDRNSSMPSVRTKVAKERAFVNANDILQLPTMHYIGLNKFDGNPGNDFYLDKKTVLPGDTVSAYAAFSIKEGAVEDASWRITIPDGYSLLENSVAKNRTPVAAVKLSDSLYEVPVGTIRHGDPGNLSFRLRADGDLANDAEAQVSLSYRSGEVFLEEIVGRAYLQASRTTISAAQRTVNAPYAVLSGRAPANYIVQIYRDGQLDGMTQASPGGYWFYTAKWPESSAGPPWEGKPTFVFQAEAKALRASTESVWSDKALVTYDRTAPTLLEVTIDQNGVRPYTIRPEEGVARFPYVIYPSYSMSFKLTFTHPERVTNVRVRSGDRTLQARYDEATKTFLAVSSPVAGQGLYVTYDVLPSPFEWSAPPDKEGWKKLYDELPAAWREADYTFEEGSDTPDEEGYVAAPTANIRFDSEGERIDLKTEWKAKAVSGVDLGDDPYKLEMFSEGENDVLEFALTAPASAFGAQGERIIRATASGDASSLYITAKFKMTASLPSAGSRALAGGSVAGAVQPLNALGKFAWNGYGYSNKADRLLEYLDHINSECDEELKAIYRSSIERLHQKATRNLIIQNTLTGIAAIAAVAALPVPPFSAILVGAVYSALGEAFNRQWESEFEHLRTEFEDAQKWRDDMAEKGIIPRCEERELAEPNQIADPVWIWDPSGYVYEGMPSNRVEGVTATLLNKDPDSDEWVVWDAEWYGQANPLISNRFGQYAWDVPEGLWQVLFDKEGFQQARSEELTVLPPHFDVNVPIVSMLPPQVRGIRGIGDGEALEFIFTKPMPVRAIRRESVSVTDASGEQVEGTIEVIGAELGYGDQQLAMVFRFVPSEPLAVGATYTFQVEGTVVSYAGVPLGDTYLAQIEIPSGSELPTEAVRNAKLSPLEKGLEVIWEETPSLELAKISVEWRKAGEATFANSVQVEPERGYFFIDALTPGTAYEVRVATVNPNDVESEGILLNATTVSDELEGADATPPADVASLKVKAEETRLTLSWTDPEDADLHSILVYWKQEGSAAEATPRVVPKGTQSLVFDNLEKNAKYEFRVTALDNRFNASEGLLVTGTTGKGGSGGPGPGNPGPGEPGPGEPGPGNPNPEEPSGSDRISIPMTGEALKWTGFEDEIRLQVPAGAFAKDSTLTVEKSSLTEPLPAGYTDYGSLFSLIQAPSSGGAFGSKVGLSLKAANIDTLAEKQTLGIYKKGAAGQWIYIGGVWNAKEQRVEARIEEPGTYAILSYGRLFPDAETHWASREIRILTARHILSGASDARFAPDRPITRAELTKLLLFLVDSDRDVPSGSADGASFRDVDPNAWYAPYVEEAAKLGIVQGNDGLFRPNDTVTREEMAVMLGRALDLKAENSPAEADFEDQEQIAAWARPYAAAAKKLKLIQGLPGNRFGPDGLTTRAQAAVILYRALVNKGLIGD